MAYSDQPEQYGGQFVGMAVAYGLSRVLGAALWLPVATTLIAGFILNRLRPMLGEALRWALALLIGQTAWTLVGVAFYPAQIGDVAVDLGIAVPLALVLAVRPHRIAVWILVAFEVVVLGIVVSAVLGMPRWDADMMGLVVNAGMRLGIIGCCAYALVHGLLREPDFAEEQEVFS
jgi:hypothetical protein